MNMPSTSTSNIDPDYVLPENEQTTNLYEQEPDEGTKKVKAIINREFKQELDTREQQLNLIQRRIVKASKLLHLLRYVLVSSYYKNAETILQEHDEEMYQIPNAQTRVHPAIKKLLGPNKHLHILKEKRKKVQRVNTCKIIESEVSLKNTPQIDAEINCNNINDTKELIKILQGSCNNASKTASIIRNRVLTKHVIIVGNISKYMPSKNPNDKLVHKWMVYVRGPKDNPDISGFVHNVVFYLHPSYKPNDIVEVCEYPFHLTRRGWGEFPLRLKVYFKNNYNKPVDIIHNLRLDKSYVGRQILGSETVVEVNLYDATETFNYFNSSEIIENEEDISKNIKIEIPDDLLANEQLDVNNFFINKFDDTANGILPAQMLPSDDSNLLESTQQNVDVDHSYSRYTISNGIKRKQTEIPIYHRKRFKIDNHIVKTEDTSCIQVYDMNRFRTAVQMITFLLKKLPLVTELAADSDYKRTFTYSARDSREYSSWNIAKRQACEWGRARLIKNAICSSDLPNSLSWTTKKIVLFARAYGFTPLPIYKPFNKSTYKEHLVDLTAPSRQKIESPIKSDNYQIDITNNSTNDMQMNGSSPSKIMMVNSLTTKYGFIKEAAFEMGAILREDEIIPGVCHNTSETLLLTAVRCFAADLLRSARADAVYKNQLQRNGGYILTENVINALNKYRPEFLQVTSFNKYTKLF